MSRIIIGDTKGGNTAYTIHGLPEGTPYMSQNDRAYWIRGFLYLDLAVDKRTTEGKTIERLLADKDYHALRTYIEVLTVTHAVPVDLIDAVKRAMARAGQEARDAQMRAIHEALGI